MQPVFEEYVAEHGVSERLRFTTCDFFKQPLPAADVIVMGHILHDWDLEQKKALIDDDRRRHAFGLLMSLN